MFKFCIFFITISINILNSSSNNTKTCDTDCAKLKELQKQLDFENRTILGKPKGFSSDKNESFTVEDEIRKCQRLKVHCLRKCCRADEIYVYEKGKTKCGKNKNQTNVTDMFNDEFNKNYTKLFISQNNVKLINGEIKSTCKQKNYSIIAVYKYNLFLNGSLLDKNVNQTVTIDNYCFEYTEKRNKSNFFRCYKKDDFPMQVTESSIENYYDNIQRKYYPYFMLVSSFFLILTFIVFICLSELRNLVGKFLSALAIMQAISFILLTVVMWGGSSRYFENYYVCKLTGYLIQYSMLSTFFWLNAMCLDIWLVIRGFSQPHRKLTKEANHKKFIKFAFYAWGSPVIISTITYLAELCMPTKSPYNPGIGEDYCLLKKNVSRMVFYYFPLTLLLIANIAMFSSTAITILKHKKEAKVLKRNGNQVNRFEQERLNLYFRLFLVMGIPWVVEPISYYFNQQPFWLWSTLDVLNVLLAGLSTFIIFVCKRRTLKVISAKFCSSAQFFTTSNDEEPNLTQSSHEQPKSCSLEMQTVSKKKT